jgi:CRP-like cAMP-binding protein
MIHPAIWGRLLANWLTGGKPITPNRSRRIAMASGGTDALGKCYKDGAVIYRQGDTGDCMYVIQKGKVEVFQRRGTQEFMLEELGDGDFFGEMALFEPEVRATRRR